MSKKLKLKTMRADKRRKRVRGKISGTAEIPRMSVAKSLKNTFIQIVDDARHLTMVGLATNSKAMADKFDDKDSKTEQAKKLGETIAELAKEKGIKKVVFDRNQYRYHGRIKAVAEGARKQGLEF
jgi:large subunit ribosomal protein L18